MLLHVSPTYIIQDVRSAFEDAFPGLKLAFFSKSHKQNKGSSAKFMISDHSATLQSLSPDLHAGILDISPDMTVWQLELSFEQNFGLYVQVFRKSGRSWLETSVSDQLTLAEQQQKAKEHENIQQEFVDPMDFREQL